MFFEVECLCPIRSAVIISLRLSATQVSPSRPVGSTDPSYSRIYRELMLWRRF